MNPSHTPITLEVCIDSLASARVAAGGGARRVELNSALELGGLTPSAGLMEQVLQAVGPMGCAVVAMVRPRPGHFVYSVDELAVMRQDVDRLLDLGVDGVALGVLDAGGGIDAQACRSLIEPVLATGREAVCHRAFDLAPDAFAAMDTLVELGFTRVLTSGQAATARQGAELIRRLIEHASGRIEVLPGSGIAPENVHALIEQTGCTQVHGTLRRAIDDQPAMAIEFNSAPLQGGAYYQADRDQVAAMMAALHNV